MEEGERLAAKQAELEGAMKRLRQQVRVGWLGVLVWSDVSRRLGESDVTQELWGRGSVGRVSGGDC